MCRRWFTINNLSQVLGRWVTEKCALQTLLSLSYSRLVIKIDSNNLFPTKKKTRHKHTGYGEKERRNEYSGSSSRRMYTNKYTSHNSDRNGRWFRKICFPMNFSIVFVVVVCEGVLVALTCTGGPSTHHTTAVLFYCRRRCRCRSSSCTILICRLSMTTTHDCIRIRH